MEGSPTTHCQICGRLIQAKNGRIAHHGYRRPGDGWQTASCFGARYRPYEVASDALPPAIRSAEHYLAAAIPAMAAFVAEPPAELSYLRHVNAYKNEIAKVAKPEGFDPARPDYRPDSYSSVYSRQRAERTHRIAATQQELAYLEERLAAWKMPAEVEG